MKRLILVFLMAFLCISAFGQEMMIKSFKEKSSDLAARTNIRTDANGNPCALVKVQMPLSETPFIDFRFDNNVIDEQFNEDNLQELWLYVSAGSKYLLVWHPQYVSWKINFAEYGIDSLKEKTTYELVISRKERTGNNVSARLDTMAVDLGLSVKWASCNVGATRPEEYGDFFAWGETKPKTVYSPETYKWYKDVTRNKVTITKYCTDRGSGIIDNKTTLDLTDDAAHVNWGGSWRMPTLAEMEELIDKCIWTETIQNSVPGYRVEGPNGNSIFLPSAGFCSDGWICGCGYYWSSSLYIEDRCDKCAYTVETSIRHGDGTYFSRSGGLSVRAVCR